jgi:hypothetical protein
MTRVIRCWPVIALLLFTGCGGTGDLSGKVTYNGKPVVYGTVVVMGSDGITKSGTIQPDGSYTVSGIRTGTAKIAVSSPQPPGSVPPKKGGRDREDDDKPPVNDPPAPPEVIKNWVPIPNKYGDPAKSEITVEVKSGQKFDIELK